jgi:hypothetical protein
MKNSQQGVIRVPLEQDAFKRLNEAARLHHMVLPFIVGAFFLVRSRAPR